MSTSRIPLNTLAVALGLAGVAQAWSAAASVSPVSPVVPQVFWAVAIIALAWLVVAHLVRGRRSTASLRDQLRDPAQGPLAAIVPIIGMLIGADLFRWWPVGGTVVALVSMLAALVFAGWLVGALLDSRIELGALHGGYLLPTVAGGYVAASAAAVIGLRDVGWAAFGVATLFWLIMTTLLIARLISRPALPDPLVPTLAVVMAPPAVGGIALLRLTDGAITPLSLGMLGLTVVLVAAQLALIPRYRRLGFSLGFWSFTFPTAAVIAYLIDWLPATGLPLAIIPATALASLVTAFVVVIGVNTLRLIKGPRARLRAEAVLRRADNVDAAMTRDS